MSQTPGPEPGIEPLFISDPLRHAPEYERVRFVLDAAEQWRDQWLVPVVEDADEISEADERLALAVDAWRGSRRDA